jgi:predicted metal-dependent phosphoesterase TrpH
VPNPLQKREIHMKVEIHSHTEVYSHCSTVPPRELIAMAEASGYDAIFITEHNRVWPSRDLAELREMCENIRIFGGIEISLPHRHDLLVLGPEDPIYETMTSPEEVLAQACADGFLTVLAHPFRYHAEGELPGFCRLVDALETRTCNHSDPEHLEAAHRYADQYNIAEVYSSDAHGLNFMNKFWIETKGSFRTPQDFRHIVLSGHFENKTRDFEMPLPPPTKTATMAELSEEDVAALSVQPTEY